MSPKQPILALLIAVAMWLAACNHSKPKATVAVSEDAKVSVSPAQAPDDLNKQIVSALQRRRYADAAALARQAKVPQTESDFGVGEIILQGHEDAAAAQAPRETIEEGLRLIEGAALAGHQQAVSSLAGTFRTGLLHGRADAFLLSPDAQLSECWDSTKEKPQLAASCIDRRRKH